MSLSSLSRARLLALTAPIFWSISGPIVRWMDNADEWQINFYRSGTLSVFVFGLLVLRYRGKVFQAIAATGTVGLVAGLCLCVAFFTNIIALKHTSIANATFLMATSPMVAAIIGWLWLKETVRMTTALAIALAFVGILIMMAGGIVSGSYVGDLVAFGGMIAFGAYAVVLRRGVGVDMTPAVLFAGLFSALLAGAVGMTLGDGLTVTFADFIRCTILGVVQIGIGSVLFAAASQFVPAAELTLYALGEPVLAPIWTWLAVGEVPVLATFIGGALILIALVVQTTGGSR